jgi:putative PIN family toxin of toxin-antitoxin system
MSIDNPGELRVVLDTNVYISAFAYPQGRLVQIWRKALSGRYKLLVSPAIVNEIAGVLRSKFFWDDDRIIARLKLLAKAAEIVIPATTLQIVKEDDDDNRIMECAVDGKAALIVSADQHLLRLKTFRGIGIIHPVDFQRTLGK